MATTLIEPAVVNAPAKTETPAQKVDRLENEAVRLGMSPEELTTLRNIGSCDAQTQERIMKLTAWLASH